MGETFRRLWENLYIRALVMTVGIVLGGWLLFVVLQRTQLAWLSFLFAYTLAYLAHPLVTRAERYGLPRWAGVLITMLVLLVSLGGISFLASQVVTELSEFAQDIPEFATLLQTLPQRIQGVLPRGLANLFEQNIDTVRSVIETFGQTVTTWLQTNQDTLIQGVVSLVGGVFQLFVVLILTAYLLYKFTRFSEAFIQIFPPRHEPFVRELTGKLDQAVGGYLRAQILIALFVGVSVWIGLALLGIPLAAFLGVIAGVFNLIPLLGPIIAGVPAVLLAFSEGFGYVLGTLAILVAINQIDGNILSPWIFSRTTNVHPVTVIVAIAFGLSLFGLWGALLAVPTAAFLKLLYKDYYKESRWYQKSETLEETDDKRKLQTP